MAITSYDRQTEYMVGTLKPYILLLPFDKTFINYSVDNGECEVKSIRCGDVIKVEGLSAVYSNEQTNEGRFKFNGTLTINIPEGFEKANFQELSNIVSGRFYTVFETEMGSRYLQSVDLPCEATYNYQFMNNSVTANVCALAMNSYSNIPTMILGDDIELIPTKTPIVNDCAYNVGRAIELYLCNYNNVVVTQDYHGMFTEVKTNGNQKFERIKFDLPSFSFAETYGDNVFSQTLTFTIPLSDYKYYWHYNLVEFTNNRYVVQFKTEAGNVVMSGFNFGFTPTYTIQTAESNTAMDTITITLRHTGDCISAYNTEGNYIIGIDTVSGLAPVTKATDKFGNSINTVVCLDSTTGAYTLFQELTSTGYPTGRYYCLEGYEDTYSNYNIVGTYNLNDDIGTQIKFQSPECSVQQGCQFFSAPPGVINFTTYGESQYFVINSECDWRIENMPSWLTITPYEGKANVDTQIAITTVAQPLPEGQSSVVKLVGSDGNYVTFVVNYSTFSDWIVPTSVNVDACSGFYDFNMPDYFHTKPVTLVSQTDGGAGEMIFGETLRLKYWDNDDYENSRTITYTLRNGLGQQAIVTITQDPMYKRLVKVDGFVCDGNTSYQKMEIYRGCNYDDINEPTGEYEKGELILEGDSRCSQQMSEWRETDDILCDGGTAYVKEEQYVSYNGGTDWVTTGETRFGDLIENNSPSCDPRYKWIDNGNRICINGNLYTQESKIFTDEAGNTQYTGDVKVGKIVESQSAQCTELEESLIEWTFQNYNYQMNTDQPLCNVVTPYEFTVNYGNGTTETFLEGKAREGLDISVNWGYNAERNNTIQIYGRIQGISIHSPEKITNLNVKKGGSLKYIRLNEEDNDNIKVTAAGFDLSNCNVLEEFTVYNHTGNNGIQVFNYPTSGTLKRITVSNLETDECYITPDQLQSIIDNAIAPSDSKMAGIMDFCDCVYIEHQTGIRHHLACEAVTTSLEAKRWLFSQPCCTTDGSRKYQLVKTGEKQCDPFSFNKVYIDKIQVSTLVNGSWGAWQDTGYEVRGDVAEYNSLDCGYVPSEMFEWRLNKNYYVCDGDKSLYAEVKYVSYDGGKSWSIVVPEELRATDQIRKMNDPDCGFIPPGTYRERWVVVPNEYICLEGEGEFNPCGFYMLWTPFGFENGKFNGLESTATALPEICDGDLFTSIDGMFENMQKLQLFPVFNTVNVVTAVAAFKNCVSLNTTDDYPSTQYDFSKLEDATSMFEGCTTFTSITLNMPRISKIDKMFLGCSNLNTIRFESCGAIESMVDWTDYNRGKLQYIYGLNVGGIHGTYDFSQGWRTLEVRHLELDNLNSVTADIHGFRNIDTGSIDYIIKHAKPNSGVKLLLHDLQYSKINDTLKTYMHNHGINYEVVAH